EPIYSRLYIEFHMCPLLSSVMPRANSRHGAIAASVDPGAPALRPGHPGEPASRATAGFLPRRYRIMADAPKLRWPVARHRPIYEPPALRLRTWHRAWLPEPPVPATEYRLHAVWQHVGLQKR